LFARSHAGGVLPARHTNPARGSPGKLIWWKRVQAKLGYAKTPKLRRGGLETYPRHHRIRGGRTRLAIAPLHAEQGLAPWATQSGYAQGPQISLARRLSTGVPIPKFAFA